MNIFPKDFELKHPVRFMFRFMFPGKQNLHAHIFEFLDGVSLVINDLGFDLEGIILPLQLLPEGDPFSLKGLDPGLQATPVLG